MRQKELRVLMQTYVDQIAGAGYEDVGLDDIEVRERRFAAGILERGSATVAGREAYMATVDVANVDQIRLAPSSRATRVRLVMVRPGFIHTDGKGKDKHDFPVLMMACHANLPPAAQSAPAPRPDRPALRGRAKTSWRWRRAA